MRPGDQEEPRSPGSHRLVQGQSRFTLQAKLPVAPEGLLPLV